MMRMKRTFMNDNIPLELLGLYSLRPWHKPVDALNPNPRQVDELKVQNLEQSMAVFETRKVSSEEYTSTSGIVT
jgi:hypothetical protein